MAYVNVKDWSVEQVTEWLKGLDNVIFPYTQWFLNNAVNGHQLLNLRADDLEHLGVEILGHQELILEAVEHLRNFHYELDKENLQMLALKLSCASNSLFKELLLEEDNCRKVKTQTLSDVHNIITTIKPLVCWLDRAPFRGDADYMDIKTKLLELSFEMATTAHRDTFSCTPVSAIRHICEKLAKIGDHIIQEISDPIILQPASLDLTTLKKKEQELGFFILSTNSPIHQIAEIKYGSPAHSSSKIEEGDEIVQVNYQTVVGWQRKNVEMLLKECPPEIVLTLKKRPRHTKVYGQIYMKPYRLPSKKRATPYSRWNENLPSPRLLTMPDLPQIPTPKESIIAVVKPDLDTETSSESDSEPPDSPLDGHGRIYPEKPTRPVLQRRNTITGASPINTRPSPSIEQYWQLLKNQAASIHSSSYHIQTNNFEEDSMILRDKSVSCSHGLELTQRPTTVIGLTPNRKASLKKSFNKKKVNFDENKEIFGEKNNGQEAKLNEANKEKSVSVSSLSSLSMTNDAIDFIDEGEDLTDRSKMQLETKENKEKLEEVKESDGKSGENSVFAEVNIHSIIKKFDGSVDGSKPRIFPRLQINKPPEIPQKPETKKPSVPPRNVVKVRGKLDKSHSTPAYDLTPETELNKLPGTLEKNENKLEPDANLNHETSKSDKDAPSTDLKHIYIELPDFDGDEPPKEEKKEVPPKPPPRTCTLDNYKPKYPAESPKPKTVMKTEFQYNLDSPKLVAETSVAIVEKPPTELKRNKSETVEKFYDNYDSKKFDPRCASTPISKQFRSDNFETETTHSIKTIESTKTSDMKISPTNSVVRAMMYSSKSKLVKKKNSIIAKRRKVSVGDVSPGEMQGYLYQRLRNKQNQNVHWEKRWFVLNRNCLYGFKSKESIKAECFISLSGFTVSPATEVRSRSNAFKVYHTGTVFYFSAEDAELATMWIETISAATLLYESHKTTEQILYSETDESDADKPKTPTTEKPVESIKKFGSLKKFTSKKSNDSTQSGSTSLDRKWFFNKSSNIKNTMPVPTAQFRSYRKIPASVSTGNFTSHIPNFAPRYEIQTLLQTQNVSVPNLTLELPKMPENEIVPRNLTLLNKPTNYIHASNPSICASDFNVQILPKMRSQANENTAGFVTLEQLMIKQAEERKLNPHLSEEEKAPINPNLIRPDVVYGEVPIRPSKDDKKKRHNRTSSDVSEKKETRESSCFGKRSGSMKKPESKISTYPKMKIEEEKYNRSLPRTHKLQETFTKNWHDIESCKSLNNLEERSYEMIYCPQTTTDVQFAQNRSLDAKMYQDTGKKSAKLVKQRSLTAADRKNTYLDSLKRSDKVGDKNIAKTKLKSAVQYTPMSLPVTGDDKGKFNPKFAFELNLDEKNNKTGKLKSFFSKQNDQKKEKTFLGSPKLHRAMFKKNTGKDLQWPQNTNQQFNAAIQTSGSYSSLSPESIGEIPVLQVIPPPADYPGLEYPPVFQPETYSLADPQSSLTLLRKQSKNN